PGLTGGRVGQRGRPRPQRSVVPALEKAGDGLEEVTEGPGRLLDAGARVAVDGAGTAAVIPLDRPDRHQAETVSLGEAEDPPGVAEVGDLGLARVVVDAGQDRDALLRPQLARGTSRIQGGQLAVYVGRGGDRQGPHVQRLRLLVQVVIESPDVDGVDPSAVRDRVLQDVQRVR